MTITIINENRVGEGERDARVWLKRTTKQKRMFWVREKRK